MGDIDLSIIAQRLVGLRKHLGERVGEKITIGDLAAKSGLSSVDKLNRLEHGKGSLEPFIAVVLYYRSQGYNLDWILTPDNTNIPMMISSSDDLLRISEMVKMLSNRLHTDYTQITNQLKEMGYAPLEDKLSTAGTGNVEVPLTFDLS